MNQPRERWWRAGHVSTSWDDLADLGPEGAEAVYAFENVAHRVWPQTLSQYRVEASRQEWSPAWVDAAASGDFPIRTTPQGLGELIAELRDVIARHDLGDQAGPDVETVILLLHGFPRRATS